MDKGISNMPDNTHPLLAIVEEEEAIRYQELEDLEAFRKGTADAPTLFRADGYVLKAESEDTSTMEFVASDESEDRLGDVIEQKGWSLSNYRKNPVVLFGHNSQIPAIGKSLNTALNDSSNQLMAQVQFDMDDPFAASIANKYTHKFMRAVSVGFKPLEFKEGENGGLRFTKQELLEISAVLVPAHPKALRKMLEMLGTPCITSYEIHAKLGNTAEDSIRAMVEAILKELNLGGRDELIAVKAQLQEIMGAIRQLEVSPPHPGPNPNPNPDPDDDLELPDHLVQGFEDFFNTIAINQEA